MQLTALTPQPISPTPTNPTAPLFPTPAPAPARRCFRSRGRSRHSGRSAPASRASSFTALESSRATRRRPPESCGNALRRWRGPCQGDPCPKRSTMRRFPRSSAGFTPRSPSPGASSVRGVLSLHREVVERERLMNAFLFFHPRYEAHRVFATEEVKAWLTLWNKVKQRAVPGAIWSVGPMSSQSPIISRTPGWWCGRAGGAPRPGAGAVRHACRRRARPRDRPA